MTWALECFKCGMPAFRLKKVPEIGASLTSDIIILKEGKALPGEPIICEHCTFPVRNFNLDPMFLVSVDN